MFGIDARYYSHIYYGLITLLSLIVFIQYSAYSQSRLQNDKQQHSIGVFLLTLVLVLFVGFRPISGRFFVDMEGYDGYYSYLEGEAFSFDWHTYNLLFDNYFNFLASKSIPIAFFFFSIAVVYFGCIAWSCSILFPKDKIAAFLVYLGAFSTFSYGTNGIKAGAAASLFLMALAMYSKRKWLWTLFFLLCSLGFHHSMELPVAAFVACLFVKDPKWYFAFWLFCFLMALFHVTFFQVLFSGFTNEHGAEYLLANGQNIRNDLLGGFRIDFALYSAVPVGIGWWAVYKKRIVSKNYLFLLNLYVFTNAIWLLCMYAAFTNRISYLSWIMLPIVLIYPFLKEEWGASQYKAFLWVAFGHLAFTLFMMYIYY